MRIELKDAVTLHYRRQAEFCASLPLQKIDQGLLMRVSCFRWKAGGLNLAVGVQVGQNTRERRARHS